MARLPEKPINWMEILTQKGNNTIKLFDDSNLLKKVKEFNKRYLYYDELKYRVKDKNEQNHIWALMKFNREERYEKINYKYLDLKFTNLPETYKHLHRFDKLLAGNIEIKNKSLNLDKRYIISSLMEEAIASSMIEGAVTTRKIAKEMLKQKRKPKDKYEQMIVNGYETMQLIVKSKNQKLTPTFLLEIQEMITKETLDNVKDVGRFRDNNNIVVGDDDNDGTIYHIPPDYKKIDKLIEELCDFVNSDNEEFIHPIIKGIILHFLIGYIHPFNDGNGRTARSVFYWYVLSKEYWLFEYMSVSRRILRSKKKYGYSYLYTEYDEFDLTYFIKYNLEAINDSLCDLLEYLKLKKEEQEDAQKLIEKIKELNPRQAIILEEIMKKPEKTFTIQEIMSSYNVVYETARTDLLRLSDLGYLIMKKVSNKYVFKINLNKKINLN
jgi:Fic family protein